VQARAFLSGQGTKAARGVCQNESKNGAAAVQTAIFSLSGAMAYNSFTFAHL